MVKEKAAAKRQAPHSSANVDALDESCRQRTSGSKKQRNSKPLKDLMDAEGASNPDGPALVPLPKTNMVEISRPIEVPFADASPERTESATPVPKRKSNRLAAASKVSHNPNPQIEIIIDVEDDESIGFDSRTEVREETVRDGGAASGIAEKESENVNQVGKATKEPVEKKKPRIKRRAMKRAQEKRAQERRVEKSPPVFISRAAEERFKQLERKELLLERGFKFTEDSLDKDIAACINRLHWDKFCLAPHDAVGTLVKEFYANCDSKNSYETKVRGKLVNWSPETINEYFGLPHIPHAQYNSLIGGKVEDILHEAKKELTNPDSEWLISATGAKSIPQAALLPKGYIWAHFIAKSFMPTTHLSTVSSERLRLIFSICRGDSINIGEIIAAEIRMASIKTAGRLFFPCLISGLCMKAGVKIKKGEKVVPPMAPISPSFMGRLKQGNDGIVRPATDSAPSNAALMKEMKEIKTQLQTFWKYAEQRDKVWRQAFRRNFSRPFDSLPPFPSSLIRPDHTSAAGTSRSQPSQSETRADEA